MNCDCCGESLMGERGRYESAVQIDLLGAHSARKQVEELFGKNKFRICYVCYLKKLGVKPKRQAEKPS